jgi:3-dehydroquinate synthase
VIVALGGGVTGDLAGFVAATFLRGVPLVQVPSSLLAMIDAAIGGKTGVDTPAGKNLVGAFHHPELVIVDPRLLATLPAPRLREGLAEAIKHGVIADAAYFGWIASSLRQILHADAPDDATALHLVQRSIEIKVGVVRQDERELGLRKTLNFGHTIGHAIEHVTRVRRAARDAVAIGMVAEAILAERLGIAGRGLADAVATVCDAANLPVRLPDGVSPAEVVAATRTDKKSRGGRSSTPSRGPSGRWPGPRRDTGPPRPTRKWCGPSNICETGQLVAGQTGWRLDGGVVSHWHASWLLTISRPAYSLRLRTPRGPLQLK